MKPHSRIRAFLVIGAAMVAAMALSITSALAQPYPPGADFGVTCTPEDPAPGDDVECTVEGAFESEVLSVSAEVDGDTFYEDEVTAEEGSATFGFTVPEDAEGDVTVTVTGAESGEAVTEVLSVSAEADADEDEGEPIAADEEALPMTGGQVTTIGLIGLVLIGGGLLALRRREDTNNAA